jgi:uncharacterized protein
VTGFAGRLLAGAAATLFLALAPLVAGAAETVPVPRLTGRVVDLSGTLDRAQQEAIAAKLAAFERSKGSQVAVLLVPTIGTETIEEFATRVTDDWKLGRAGVDDGVLFVIAKQERRMRIQTGRGVQGVLTDALSRRIIAERVTPRFRAGDFAGGIHDGVDAIIKAIEGEALPEPARAGSRGTALSVSSLENFFWIALVVVPVAGAILRSLLGRFLGATLTSGVTGLAAWLVLGSVLLGLVAAVAAFIAILLMGTPGLSARRGGPGGWTSGGSWGGGGGWSSGGGGGFSGGGGGFDGGGASGGW